MAKNRVRNTVDSVKINHVLISVSDKTGLDELVPALIRINPDIKIFSTGGTFSALSQIIGKDAKKYLLQVSEYTGQPETQGGLVKTLDFKIYLGLLTESDNPDHLSDLKRTNAVPIDMVVVNLYPFSETVKKTGATPEDARANIDIGGPTMIRAAAKNFLRVASVVNPDDYTQIVSALEAGLGSLPLSLRFELGKRAFNHTAAYDQAISQYLSSVEFSEMASCYKGLNP